MTPVTICMMAKAPVAGRVKTRLARSIGDRPAARLAAALLVDSWTWIQAAGPALEPVLVLDGARRALPELHPPPCIWHQRAGSLGDRLERALRRAARGSEGGALAIGTDTVGLPAQRLVEAARAVAEGRAVLGPTDDGGYYVIGVPCAPPRGALHQVRWSSRHAFADTARAFDSLGWTTQRLPRAFDIDRIEDLERLREQIERGDLRAPATARALVIR